MEKWLQIPNMVGYFVSDAGRIKSFVRNKIDGKIVKSFSSKKGYLFVHISINKKWNRIKIHRLVALTFIPTIENKPQVNHINGIKTDNRVENLEWVSPKENTTHAITLGLRGGLRGEKNGLAKLSSEQVLNIRDVYPSKSLSLIAKEYDIAISTVQGIIHRRRWKHI